MPEFELLRKYQTKQETKCPNCGNDVYAAAVEYLCIGFLVRHNVCFNRL